MHTNNLIQSPLNYVGGKFKLLPQILPLLPKQIDCFIDVFAGGLNVGINVDTHNVIANDINFYVVELLSYLKNNDIDVIVKNIEMIIDNYKLTKQNKDGFNLLRQQYNADKNPLVLYVLICFSFNHLIRFNNNLDYNNTFGLNRSHFSQSLKHKLIKFHAKLNDKNIEFYAKDFTELLPYLLDKTPKNSLFYFDPPYLITTASYNDGNRGFKDWNETQERRLHDQIDLLNAEGFKFALSNVLTHKGKTNHALIAWSKKYQVNNLNHDYSNSCFNTSKGDSNEVLITNF